MIFLYLKNCPMEKIRKTFEGGKYDDMGNYHIIGWCCNWSDFIKIYI